MSIDKLPRHIQMALNRIIGDSGLQNYTIAVKRGSEVGDGFLGELTSVAAKGVRNDVHDNSTNLICKLPPTNENRRKEFKCDIKFETEIYFYTKVLSTFVDFQREKLIPEAAQFRAHPKCYAGLGLDGDCDYAIIMEDLRPKGFQMWNKAKPTTLGNIRLVLEQIGKFHAISFAIKDQRPDEFAELIKLTDKLDTLLESKYLLEIFKRNCGRAKNVLRNDRHKEIMSKMETNCADYILSYVTENESNGFAVVVHSDLWNNNIMYRFNENEIVEEVRFVDWQLIRYVSPAIDLILHIFSATDKDLRDAEYMNLLRHYHNSLSQMIQMLGSDPDKLFTFDNLLDEMKRAGNFAFFLTPFLLSVSLADSSQITNLDEICNRKAIGERISKDFITGLSDEAQIEFESRINDVIGDLVDLDYFKDLKI